MTFLLESGLRSSIVLLAGLLALALLKRQPAALRHSILAAAIALAVAQPAINRTIPALPMPVIELNADPGTAGAPPVQSNVNVDLPAAAPRVSATPIDWLRIAFMMWAAGAMIGLAMLGAGLGWLCWLQSRSTRAGSNWQIESNVRIFVTQHPALIVTWGVIAPAILLPSDADSWSADRKRLVIAHEMAHLLRRDWLVQLLAEIARSIYWFNPLFWIACARLRRESEYASDDAVLGSGIAGTSYAAHLVDLARTLSVHGRTWLPAPSIARPSTLERRVRAMLNPALNRRPVPRRLRLAIVALLCAIALPIAAASQASSTPSGRVSDPSGRPLADATLRLSPANGGEAAETRTDANGGFQFGQVAAGEYMLSVRYPGFSSSRQRMQLSGGATTIELQVQVGTLRETVTVVGPDAGYANRSISDAATAVPPACAPSPTGGQLIPPTKIRDVRPRYKQEWVDAGVKGSILMKATIAKDGKVRGVDLISGGNVELEDEAMAAVAQWLFTPTYLNCEAVEVQMYVTVDFKGER